ncbi:MAG: hypothetical protein RH917_11835 [Lacipirellulaceae bacterium]
MFFTIFANVRRLPWASLLGSVVLLLSISLVGQSDEKESLPVESINPTDNAVLLLHTEGVIEGTVKRAGDWYQVRQANGAELEIPADRVAGYFRTLREAYESSKPRGQQATPRRHLALAHWCLEHDLIDAAREQLSAAQSMTGLETEKVRLEKELLKRTEVAKASTAPSKVPPQVAPVNRVAEEAPLAGFSLKVRQDFVRSIQPMLIRNCCQCHAENSDRAFKLSRAALNGSGDANLIGQNFLAVANYIDQESTLDSELLAFAKQTHGQEESRAFPSGSKPLRRHQAILLRDWCYAVFEVPKPGEVADSEATVEEGDLRIDEAEDSPIRDEFDPAIFNRRSKQVEQDAAQSSLDE